MNKERFVDVGKIVLVWMIVTFLVYFLPASVGAFMELSWDHYLPVNWQPESRLLLGAFIAIETACTLLLTSIILTDKKNGT